MSTYPEDLCRLTLENAELIEDSLTVINNIEERISTNICNYIKQFAADNKLKDDLDEYGIEGGFWKDSWKDGALWKAYFYFEITKNGNSDWFISSLLGCRGAKVAIKFYLDPSTFDMTKKQIQSKLPFLYNENNENEVLQEKGFYINQENKNTIDIDFTITTEEALNSYLYDKHSFKELDSALNNIVFCLDTFNNIIKKIKK